MMTSRQRLTATLNHKPVDRVCVDFGAGGQTGISAQVVSRLRKHFLGDATYRVKITEPYQMLGEVDESLRQALGCDVIGIDPLYNMFGVVNKDWKRFDTPNGTSVLVPGDFNYTLNANGDILMHPHGDISAPPSAIMPRNGFYFDAIERQEPIREEDLNPVDNCEEFGQISDAEIQHYVDNVNDFYENTEYGIYVTLGGLAFGDIALVPGPWMKHPRGIRSVSEWYMSLASRQVYLHKVFETQCEFALQNIDRAAAALGDKVQVVFVSGTDFGTQRGPFISPKTFRELFKPYQKRINDHIHEKTTWKTFMHCCGGIVPLLPDIIEAGFDILNPVQCSAEGMDPHLLKREFGRDLVFWGGGVDTQKTLPFGSPDEVYHQVRERIDIFNEGGGFVFAAIHNIQSNTPVENVLAMLRAIKDSHGQS
ncbi:MAG: hypothetical protein JW709_01200 [Sedimentisphaerales bacterium]|nr:hypothetical protein [Sedimentisphaerales bacterium]